MLNICILDDDAICAQDTKCMVEEYFDCREMEINRFDVFHDGTSLLKSKTKYDVLFLDIEVGNENGIDIAKKLRIHEPDMIIVVITSYLKYSMEGYKIQAARYLLKPVAKSLLFSELDEVLSLYDHGSYIIARDGATSQRIRRSDIYYIESYGRKVCIHTRSEAFISKESFGTWVEQLDASMFRECYKGILVHLKHIKMIQKEIIQLENGQTLPLARRRVEEINRKWFAYQEKSL